MAQDNNNVIFFLDETRDITLQELEFAVDVANKITGKNDISVYREAVLAHVASKQGKQLIADVIEEFDRGAHGAPQLSHGLGLRLQIQALRRKADLGTI